MMSGNVNFSYLVHAALEAEITWDALENLLSDLTPTLEKSKQLNKVFLNELKILQSQKKEMDFKFKADSFKEDDDIFDEELKVEDESTFEQNEIDTIIDQLEVQNGELCSEEQFHSDS